MSQKIGKIIRNIKDVKEYICEKCGIISNINSCNNCGPWGEMVPF